MLEKGASQLNRANEVGNKVTSLLIKLLAVHGKGNINVFSETHCCLEVENFSKNTKEVKDLLAYETTEGHYNNILLILHMNNVFLNMTIFHNTKETVTKIGHLMMIHPKWIYWAACQEHLNEALATVASELDNEGKTYFLDCGTAWQLANYDAQLKLATPTITIDQTKMETTALAVYALCSHARIAQDLMMRVAPHVNQHGFNFIPANLPYNKSICDGKYQYAQLLKE
eukprot:987204-Ditylum_brightwellii.AAC.1